MRLQGLISLPWVQLNVSVPYLDQTCIYVTNGGTTTSNGVEASTGFQLLRLYDAAVARAYPDGPTGQDYSSIVSDRHYARLTGLLEAARQDGARIVEVGRKPETTSERRRTIAPTLIVGTSDESAVMREEIFGPILPVRTYRSIDEVIDYVNGRPRPLALYVFGPNDADRASILANTMSGNVGIKIRSCVPQALESGSPHRSLPPSKLRSNAVGSKVASLPRLGDAARSHLSEYLWISYDRRLHPHRLPQQGRH